MPYHSALRDELEINGQLDFYANDRGTVMAWDITQGVSPFWQADAIYAEPAWRDGYNKFLARAGQPGSSNFFQYLEAIRSAVRALGKPAYVIAGKHMLPRLQPHCMIQISIHGYPAYAAIWFASPPATEIETSGDLLSWVCGQYETVLDFCCGYGNVAQRAQRFICSDINPHCVYYVASTYMGYVL